MKDTLVIGNIARYNYQKDHLTLLKALSEIKKNNLNFKAILIGKNVNKSNIKLIKKVKKLNLLENVILFDQLSNVSDFTLCLIYLFFLPLLERDFLML